MQAAFFAVQAVCCGSWHGVAPPYPRLEQPPVAKAAALLSALPRQRTDSPHPKSSLHFGFQGAGCFFGCAAAFATGRTTRVGTAAQRRENR
ncbi:hypothetical protein [Kingella denitrificans]|uniref:hypothetical protein n=1 Tax=Kingella denitrificans TaxID=502 RepID=UPI0011C05F59|nr:hypothetical protein [Kingella denitrificans]QQB41784.1 hypothetical protein I6I17_10000 [Kingella denitrificans]